MEITNLSKDIKSITHPATLRRLNRERKPTERYLCEL